MVKRKLVIFDIDQTLVKSTPYHKITFENIEKDVYGVDGKLTEIKYAGKTLAECLREVGELHGIDKKTIDSKMKIVYKKYGRKFKKIIIAKGDTERRILPGVKNLLKSLSKTDHILGVVTGNIREIAEIILKESKLRKYFHIVITSDQAKTRPELVGIAIKQAKKKYGMKFIGKNLIIIGDSIHDVESGKPYGAVSIAVTTGIYSVNELKKHKPQHVMKNLGNYKRILKIIEK